MNKYLDYVIIPDKELIVHYYCGTIRIQDYLDHKTRLSKDKAFCSTYKSIEDFRDAELDITSKEVKGYVEFVKNSAVLNGERMVALLTKTPNQVVKTTIFEVSKNDLPVHTLTVSTTEAAVDWVRLPPEDLCDILVIIRDFKNKANVKN